MIFALYFYVIKLLSTAENCRFILSAAFSRVPLEVIPSGGGFCPKSRSPFNYTLQHTVWLTANHRNNHRNKLVRCGSFTSEINWFYVCIFLYIIYFIILNIYCILYNKIYRYKYIYIYWVPKIWEYVQDFVLGVFKHKTQTQVDRKTEW